ncbi:MAG: NAD-dependent epimerase/dehydratase family protein [Acidobacteriota bacterium]
MNTVLVTGGSGFLGRAVVGELRSAGHAVRTLQRQAAPASDVAALGGDVRDPDAVAAAVEGVDVVVHAAGLAHVFRDVAAAPFHEVNEKGAAVVAAAAVAAGVRHFVHISSVAVYGGSGAAGVEGAPCRPQGDYAHSKAAAETRVVDAARGSATRVTILRLATLYGDGDRGNVQRLLQVIAAGRFVWVGSGANLKSLIHVRDAARACAAVVDSEAAGSPTADIYNVSAAPVVMREIVGEIARALGRPVPRGHVPDAAARMLSAAAGWVSPSRAQSLAKWLNDDVYPAGRFEQRFDVVPRVTLREGIERQVRAWRASAGEPA